ncbi:lipopolysaccharide biosynthesis protein [Gluconacetobacter entanii]|uniref:lipopolysaccharide biosynthesis protein n=1 Tax=Gluconacetobacter entanii TaxID=108528 RepID=UPI001C9346D7|nr:lipopolysaccharide biosynthesis protein [Gluconacetobacter entanii]MBY4640707.1 lipopolysaccharide biosynthesis protein [Gluconacetobacter entanii]MCW4581901.1 lipopolysaccharide biosynthesis protein [Gluconacetobacter entanii]MCW4585357.1 lipopolysaccharide biosynthesis protein [Gluconacetobacter entanii]MCW4588934.1 lipopolysaccharide biosynthesis protein [Gluconacetobacter entanii]
MAVEETGTLRRIFGNTGFLVAGRATNAVCSFLYMAWSVRALGLSQFGVLMLVTTFGSAISSATHLPSWQPLLHYGTEPFVKGNLPRFHRILFFCMRADLLSGATGALVGMLGVWLFGTSMGWPQADQLGAMVYMLTICVMNTGWSTGIFRLCNAFWLSSACDLSGVVVRMVGTGVGLWLHMGLYYFMMVWSMTQLALFITNSAMAWWLLRSGGKVRRFQPFRQLEAGDAPGIWRFTLSTSGNHVLGTVFNQFGTLLVGGLFGPADAAVYRVSRQIGDGIAKPAQLMMPALYPEFIRLREKHDWYGLKHVTLRLFMLIGGFSLLLMLFAMVAGNTLLTWMLRVHWPGGNLMIMLMLGNAIMGLGIVPLEPLLTVVGQVSRVLIARIVVTIAYLPLVYFMAWRWHLEGAASASVLASLMMLLICMRPVMTWFGKVAPGRRPREVVE